MNRDPDTLIDDPHAYKEEYVTDSDWKVLKNYTNIYGNCLRPSGYKPNTMAKEHKGKAKPRYNHTTEEVQLQLEENKES